LKDSEIIIFPNPSRDFITVSGTIAESHVTISNNINKIVINQAINGETKIDISDLADGIYTVIISSKTTKVTQRFVKI